MIRFYGLLIGIGILVGFWVASRIAQRFKIQDLKFKISSEEVWDVLWWIVIPGVIGARLYHVIDLWDYYRDHLTLIPAVWTGGMGIFGAIAGGIVGLWLYCGWMCWRESRSRAAASTHSAKGSDRKISPAESIGESTGVGGVVGQLASSFTRGPAGLRVPLARALFRWYERLVGMPGHRGLRKFVHRTLYEKISTLFSGCVSQRFLVFSDLAAFGLPVGQAIGRWGNFFNQELYGKPSDLPWSITIAAEHRLSQVAGFERFHPLFLYESLWSLVTFGLLVLVFRRWGRRLAIGSYFASYLLVYGAGRFFLEGLRIESWAFGGVNVARFVSLLGVSLGGYYLYSNNIK